MGMKLDIENNKFRKLNVWTLKITFLHRKNFNRESRKDLEINKSENYNYVITINTYVKKVDK